MVTRQNAWMVFAIITLLAVPTARAGVVLVTGSDADTFHGLTEYATAVRDFLKGGAAADLLVLGGAAATTAYSSAVGGVGITTVSSLAGVDLSDFSALYLLSGSGSGTGCCEADVDLILGFEAAIQTFMAAGGGFGIQTYTGDPGFDPLLGTVGGANGEVFGFMGGLGGPVSYDDEAVTPEGLLAGFTNYAPLGLWGHQGFRMSFFGDLGFVSLIDAPTYGTGVSGVMARGIAEGECLTVTSQEIVCHADGTTFTVNIEGLNACTGGTSMFTFTGSGGAVGEEMCFTVLVDDGGFCCSTEVCVTIPDCTGGTGALEILTIDTGADWANSTISAIPGHNVTTITEAGIGGIDFTLFDVLYVTDAFNNPATPAWAGELIARGPDIDTYINGGGFVIVGVEAFGGDSATNGDEYNFLPSGLVDGQTVGTQVFGDDVVITDPTHPLFDGITSADLSNWGVSYHGSLPVGTLPVLATNAGGQVLIRGGSVGAGGVFVWSLDPDYHHFVNIPGTLPLVENAIGLVQAAQPAMPSDLDGDGIVGNLDFLALLAAWGSCSDCGTCAADFDGDCSVGIGDLLILLGNWG